MPIRFHVNAGPFTSQVNYMATIQLLSEQIHGSACTDPAINEKASDETSKLPYWLVNVPRNEWLAECPECLKSISDKDRGIIGTEDAAWHRMSWADVREVISKYDTPSRGSTASSSDPWLPTEATASPPDVANVTSRSKSSRSLRTHAVRPSPLYRVHRLHQALSRVRDELHRPGEIEMERPATSVRGAVWVSR